MILMKKKLGYCMEEAFLSIESYLFNLIIPKLELHFLFSFFDFLSQI